MIRGRRGIAVVAAFFLACILFIKPVSAIELAMTATVPLSSTWKELIAENSVYDLDTHSHRNIAELTVQLKGIDGVTIPPQNIQALLFGGWKLADNQIKTTDAKGNVSFTFVYKRGESYRIILVGSPDESPYVLKVLAF